ncbi:Flp family type IVb pilin [Erythrobacter colymbi]|uniref:Flp family type IVb pilin n=1 Tax=Erythrobacter colymbi TaxID=1161202 RepID=UPI001F0B531B|nr:Flp family type IVb pilin [Erythrobacter colymbi]
MKKLVGDQSGATAIEYGLILALIALVMSVALQDVAGTTIQMWNRVESESVAAMTN